MEADFNSLLGAEFDFYGVDCNEFKLDNTIWEALEDKADGFRSYLGSVVRKESTGIFFRQPLARVKLKLRKRRSRRVFKLVDLSDGHVWLEFGTDHNLENRFYPFFVFRYSPKPS